MKQTILILGTDKDQFNQIADLLGKNGYQTEIKNNFSLPAGKLQDNTIAAVIIDIDDTPQDNRVFRRFKQDNPNIVLLAVSSRPFHPELKESMEKYIFACTSKPVDPDEILFLLKSGCDRDISGQTAV